MKSEKVSFNNDDGQTLAGVLELPVDEEPVAYALFAHCFTCSKNFKAATHVSRALAAEGIAVLRFDFTGLGESEGDFADTNFSSNVEDLVAAARFLEHEYDAPGILIGHSLGGAAVLQAAAQIPSARAVATVAAPCDPEHVTGILDGARDDIEARGHAEVSLAGRKFTIKKQFIDDLEATRMRDTIASLDRALAVFHSPQDEIVGIENAARIFEAAMHPKSFISLDGADHLLSNETDSRYVGTVIAAWAVRYLDTVELPEPAGDEWVTARTGASGYFTEIRSRGHQIIADEPTSYGGSDLGASPYELLSAALGACTTMTLRMYADRKKWPLDGVTVKLKHDKVHAADCEHCDTEGGKVDRITRVVIPQGHLSDEQRQRLLEIADKCPVHRTLHSEIDIPTTLEEQA